MRSASWPGDLRPDDPEALPVSPWVIRREAFERQLRARDVLAEAQEEAQAILARAGEEACEERRLARAAGLQAGQAEAARLMAAAVAEVDAFVQAREAELAELVLAAACRLVGALPEVERMARIVSTAMAEYRHDLAVTLRTDPDGAATVRQAVERLGLSERVHVQASESQPPGSCTLVHPRGQAQIGMLDQFRALMAACSQTAAAQQDRDAR